jgi:hypothetical protein
MWPVLLGGRDRQHGHRLYGQARLHGQREVAGRQVSPEAGFEFHAAILDGGAGLHRRMIEARAQNMPQLTFT